MKVESSGIPNSSGHVGVLFTPRLTRTLFSLHFPPLIMGMNGKNEEAKTDIQLKIPRCSDMESVNRTYCFYQFLPGGNHTVQGLQLRKDSKNDLNT